MKVKKTLSLILACLMFSSFAAACSGESSGEMTGTGWGDASAPGTPGDYNGSGYGSGSAASGSLGDYESAGSGSGGSSGGSSSDYEQSGNGGSSGSTSGSGNYGDYESDYMGGSSSGSSNDYVSSGDGGASGVISGGSTDGFESDYTGGTTDSGSVSDYETPGTAPSAGNNTTGDLNVYEDGEDTSYQGDTEFAADEWRDGQIGYNNFYYTQLGDEVMPIGAWCAPPPATTATVNGTTVTYETDQITLENYQKLAASGINSIYGLYDRAKSPGYTDVLKALDFADQVGIVYLVKDASAYTMVGLEGTNVIDDQYYAYMSKPAYGGTLFVDEPGVNSFEQIGESTYEWKKHELFGETKLALVNNLPSYASAAQLYYGAATSETTAPIDYNANYVAWLEKYMQMVEPQVFSFDYYAYNTGNSDPLDGYFKSLSDIRSVTQKYNVPFWTFNQVGHWGVANNDYSLAQMAFQVHTSLAYGAKGIQWFNYWHPLEMPDSNTCGLVDKLGKETKYYSMVQSINAQVAAVDHVLMKSKSVGVMQLNNSCGGSIPSSDLLGSYGAVSAKSGTGDAIIGCFEYRDIGWAYYIASNSVTNGATVTLTFNTTYNDVEIIQDTVSTKQSANSVTVSVAEGQGALVVVKK
ncbi:MAG: hypothetical protein IJY11_01295 [Clostridia bacterium]|nr:hypothetical protein [Clostridia bacterium]